MCERNNNSSCHVAAGKWNPLGICKCFSFNCANKQFGWSIWISKWNNIETHTYTLTFQWAENVKCGKPTTHLIENLQFISVLFSMWSYFVISFSFACRLQTKSIGLAWERKKINGWKCPKYSIHFPVWFVALLSYFMHRYECK